MNTPYKEYYLICIIVLCFQYLRADENMCDFNDGDYKTVRLLDGKIALFKAKNYYVFSDGDIKNAKIKPITDLYPHNSTQIRESFEFNGKIYYLRGNEAIVYKEHIEKDEEPKHFVWNQNQNKVDHLIIRQKGETTGFFVPPLGSNSGSGRSVSKSNDLEVISFGSGSISTSSVNGEHRIRYNGWNIPNNFNAFMVNTNNTIIFFDTNMYCVVERNSRPRDFEWKRVSQLFGC